MSNLLMPTTSDHKLRGVLKENEHLSRHTSWRVGGPVKNFYQPADVEDLALFLESLAEEEPIFWIGLGSNLLVRDGGLKGTVIATSGGLSGLEFLDNNCVRAESGVACPKFARECAKRGLSGIEFLCGIPGTVGGALAMNAGALGSETWQWVETVETIDRHGQVRTRTADEFEVSYRHVAGPDGEWFVAATFRLEQGDTQQSLDKIKKYLARRSATQPTQLPNAGSVFRNPENDYAARLIEHCGLKNYCIGGACVSEKHANFIINTGTATAGDIERLIEYVWQCVKAECGIELIREVHIVGEKA